MGDYWLYLFFRDALWAGAVQVAVDLEFRDIVSLYLRLKWGSYA